MNQLTPEEIEYIELQFIEILNVCPRCKTDEDKAKVRKAFDLANEAHKSARRRSGEPYIFHPIEVSKICAQEIGLGTTSLICALLHDVVEDTDISLEQIRNMFGDKVATIIDGLTKIAAIFDQSLSLQAENFRKMLLTLSDDVRVILIKLADRLHNMRTLEALPEYKQAKIAAETLFIYAPLAHRLGLYAIKTELEDLCLKVQHPVIYSEIKRKLAESALDRQKYINRFSMPIISKLKDNNLEYSITGRPKSVYSIWNKMNIKNVGFEEIYDLFAIRIIFDTEGEQSEKKQCWNIYSLVTDIYQPKPDRLRDWVSTPKANGYEALHTTVMGPDGKWVEVQIRSKRMDEIAERGYAAHWKYKGDQDDESELDKWIKKIREMLENPESDALEFLNNFKMNLFASEIFVFTPKGQLRRLPKESTALDFAFDIHSQIGNHAIGAKVNHKLVSLGHKLKSGDQVEILTSEIQLPQLEWLEMVETVKAKSKIKEHFKNDRREKIVKGKTTLEETFLDINMPINSQIFRRIMSYLGTYSKEELYYKIGNGEVDFTELKKAVKRKSRSKWIRYWQIQISKTTSRLPLMKRSPDTPVGNVEPIKPNKKVPLSIEENLEQKNVSIAKCCNPIPGDDVIGYINDDSMVIIHKKSCNYAVRLMSSFGNRVIPVKWTAQKVLSFLARIELNGIDNIGVVSNITNLISKELDVNMRSIYFDAHDGIFEGYIDLYVKNTSQLTELVQKIRKVKGINKVTRVEDFEEDLE
ncbi:MAG: GTP pyrophosphokinase [Bacteroidetes bacterium HGW-Bacteroidetes-21]|jgi:GTP pyrophosphokinase|nr:MAG: GTP pyrophosphokinase [Bacteroidetes bacterium HGW-Bacteroidetes-21]